MIRRFNLALLYLLGLLLLVMAGCSVDSENGETANDAPAPDQKVEGEHGELTSVQYHVTRENDTETPFENEYWDNDKDGIYVDIISGEPLFSSEDQYDDGSGWPSFTKPLDTEQIEEKSDNSLPIERTEVRSEEADSHLGHVFEDGPEEEGGMRYCINSASLKFIPKENLAEEGFEEYKHLFTDEEK